VLFNDGEMLSSSSVVVIITIIWETWLGERVGVGGFCNVGIVLNWGGSVEWVWC